MSALERHRANSCWFVSGRSGAQVTAYLVFVEFSGANAVTRSLLAGPVPFRWIPDTVVVGIRESEDDQVFTKVDLFDSMRFVVEYDASNPFPAVATAAEIAHPDLLRPEQFAYQGDYFETCFLLAFAIGERGGSIGVGKAQALLATNYRAILEIDFKMISLEYPCNTRRKGAIQRRFAVARAIFLRERGLQSHAYPQQQAASRNFPNRVPVVSRGDARADWHAGCFVHYRPPVDVTRPC